MPIEIEEFEATDENELGGQTNAERVLGFLARNADKAFRQTEIAERADVKPGSIGPVLSRLEDRRLVRHKGVYWAIETRDRLRAAGELTTTLRLFDEKFGPEDPDDWRPDAEDRDE